MKFASGKLYIEQYLKCCNCGVLIYEDKMASAVKKDQDLYCSEWCVDWSVARASRVKTAQK